MEKDNNPNMDLIGSILSDNNINFDIDDWVYLTYQMELKHGQNLNELPTERVTNSLLNLIKKV